MTRQGYARALLKEPFEMLATSKIIPHELGEKLSKMVGFRNIAVLEYRIISQAILESILKNHLGDLKDFIKIIGKLL